MSVSCVFFPEESDLSGVHATPCLCHELYGSEEMRHPDFHTWPEGQAPWGCQWCITWRTMTNECHKTDQKAVVVYKSGQCGDPAGIGFSQRGEVRWMEQNGIPFAKCDIDQFAALVGCAHEGRDGAVEVYWPQAPAH